MTMLSVLPLYTAIRVNDLHIPQLMKCLISQFTHNYLLPRVYLYIAEDSTQCSDNVVELMHGKLKILANVLIIASS